MVPGHPADISGEPIGAMCRVGVVDQVKWDFFLAHASADSGTAERLRSLLEPEATVFEDSMLHAGEEWDVVLDRHLRASAITVVLVSSHSESSHYLRSEITRAIGLARGASRRRVVPLVLEPVDVLPYGLDNSTKLQLSTNLDLAGAARRLLASLHDLHGPRREGPRETAARVEALLTDLDRVALSGGDTELLRAAIDEVGRSDALLLHLRRRGLDPRVVLPSLPGHDEAMARWSLGAAGVPGAAELPAAVRRQLRRHMVDGRTDLTAPEAAMRRELLTGRADSPDARRLATALTVALPPLRSTSTEAVLVGSAGVPAAPEVLSPLHQEALRKTRLDDRDPSFVGRDGLVADLAGRITKRLARRGCATAFVTGQLGAGVSAVAIEVAHALRDRFPGGVRHVKLNGLDKDARLDDVIAAKQVCHSLGETPIPGSELEQYHAALEGRGVLLVLDGALDAKHVVRLTPAPPTCAIIVTSRVRTQGYADQELVTHVPPLDRASSVRLLSQVHGRVDADEAALDQIARLCADLPMALRLIAAWMISHPEAITTTLASELAREKLRLEFMDDGVRPMRLAIELSYRHLDDDARRAFRFLPAVPGSAATGTDLGRGLERDPDLTQLTLYRLVDRNVAGYEEQADRHTPMFRLFELVRLYALDRLEKEESPEAVARFRRLLVTRLLDKVHTGGELDPALRLDPTPLTAARDLAEREKWFGLAAGLTDGLRVLHTAEADEEAAHHDRRRAAELRDRDGDPEGAVRAYLELARGLDGTEAEEILTLVERIAERAGLPGLIGEVAFETAKHREARSDLAGALAAGERAVTALTTAGRRASAVPVGINNTVLALRLCDRAAARRWAERTRTLVDHRTPVPLRADIAYEHARASDDATALAYWREAVRLYREVDNLGNAGLAAYYGGWTAMRRSSPAEAAELFLTAADLQRRAGDVDREVWALIALTATYAEVGQYAHARDVLTGLLGKVPADRVWHPGVVTELQLRVAVLGYLDDGMAPAPVQVPAVTSDKAPDSGARLAKVSAALRRPETAKDVLREFAESSMVYSPPPHQPWIHKNLGEELPDRPQLE
jgi:tetratricopeptide (TPR) repeat protein